MAAGLVCLRGDRCLRLSAWRCSVEEALVGEKAAVLVEPTWMLQIDACAGANGAVRVGRQKESWWAQVIFKGAATWFVTLIENGHVQLQRFGGGVDYQETSGQGDDHMQYTKVPAARCEGSGVLTGELQTAVLW
jgi:hypothetical protein